jgi:hypothetical protein
MIRLYQEASGNMALTLVSVSFFQLNLRTLWYNFYLASPRNIFPPSHMCKNPNCIRSVKGQKLQSVKQRMGVLYTLEGPVPIYSAFLTCQGELSIKM